MWRAITAVALLSAVTGCGRSIGDSCTTNVDCSPLGDRFCDTAPLHGYCTIENCGIDSCPSEAVCVRFFTPALEQACHFDSTVPFSRSDCPHPDDRCVCDSSVNGQCVSGSDGTQGHCAPSSTERRWCQRKCSSNGDCRSGYECRSTGSDGAEPVPTFDVPAGTPAKFCAPTGN